MSTNISFVRWWQNPIFCNKNGPLRRSILVACIGSFQTTTYISPKLRIMRVYTQMPQWMSNRKQHTPSLALISEKHTPSSTVLTCEALGNRLRRHANEAIIWLFALATAGQTHPWWVQRLLIIIGQRATKGKLTVSPLTADFCNKIRYSSRQGKSDC